MCDGGWKRVSYLLELELQALLSYFSINVMRWHDPGNLEKKAFVYLGACLQFKRGESVDYHGGSMTADRQGGMTL